ncbi:hypothetical protein B0H67DRAFT_649913 [Lasiosphaeris hirsuta]|uniref:Uncharacterized protein n=1 Tax=Lasiosphaeris hirsuta TaxID=260670 RepID=A0AA39ZXR4_9PEZI|nr:hypothetical protein B0H67DRAFT_649913 [Lasiosphaeris hirsuta]
MAMKINTVHGVVTLPVGLLPTPQDGITRMKADSRKNIAKMKADSRKKIAKMEAESREKIAKMEADSHGNVTRMQLIGAITTSNMLPEERIEAFRAIGHHPTPALLEMPAHH